MPPEREARVRRELPQDLGRPINRSAIRDHEHIRGPGLPFEGVEELSDVSDLV